ncbi:MAG: hypothetical protein ACRYGA_00245 [Janthinobacterium lividum]
MHASVDQNRGKAIPQATWVDDRPTAAKIEKRLWEAYEQRFAANHEESLAYRYEPANEEERVFVLRYFPTVSFALAKGQHIENTTSASTHQPTRRA